MGVLRPDVRDEGSSEPCFSLTWSPKSVTKGPANFNAGALSVSGEPHRSAGFKGDTQETVTFIKPQTEG